MYRVKLNFRLLAGSRKPCPWSGPMPGAWSCEAVGRPKAPNLGLRLRMRFRSSSETFMCVLKFRSKVGRCRTAPVAIRFRDDTNKVCYSKASKSLLAVSKKRRCEIDPRNETVLWR
jgi:hypothetical protein